MSMQHLVAALQRLPAGGQESELLSVLADSICTELGWAACQVRRSSGGDPVASAGSEVGQHPKALIELPGGWEVAVAGMGEREALTALCTAAAKLLEGGRLRAKSVQRAERAVRRGKELAERHRNLTLRLEELRGELDTTQQNHLVLSERNRIAQDLHDRAAQTNFLLALKLDWVLAHLSVDDPLQGELSRLKELATQAATQTREAIYALRAQELAKGGLVGGLRRLVRALEADGLTTSLNTTGIPVPLSPQVEDGLFKIAQEALNNIHKHSRGTAVIVALRFSADYVTLVIQDNGVGLQEGVPLEPPGRFGIRGMRERATALGGELRLLGGDDGGLIVRASIPLKGVTNHGNTHLDRR